MFIFLGSITFSLFTDLVFNQLNLYTTQNTLHWVNIVSSFKGNYLLYARVYYRLKCVNNIYSEYFLNTLTQFGM